MNIQINLGLCDDLLQIADPFAFRWHLSYSGFDLWLAVALPTLSHSS